MARDQTDCEAFSRCWGESVCGKIWCPANICSCVLSIWPSLLIAFGEGAFSMVHDGIQQKILQMLSTVLPSFSSFLAASNPGTPNTAKTKERSSP